MESECIKIPVRNFVDLIVYFPLLTLIRILLFMESIILCISRRRCCCQHYTLFVKRFFVVVAVSIVTGLCTVKVKIRDFPAGCFLVFHLSANFFTTVFPPRLPGILKIHRCALTESVIPRHGPVLAIQPLLLLGFSVLPSTPKGTQERVW